MSTEQRIMEILREVKKLGQENRSLTGKPLGITGEGAEFEAARILTLQLTTARQAGYDAIELSNSSRRKLQIKGRCVLEDSKRSQRVGRIKVDAEFDAVLLVLLDQNFDATVIYEADRGPVIAALIAPGSKARNEKGALAVSKFKAISRVRWKR